MSRERDLGTRPVVVVAPDKFKGSLTAVEVARAVAAGLESTGVETRLVPLADGGDGTVAAALGSGFESRSVEVLGAAGTPTTATIAVRGETAVIEVANTCGLSTLPGDLEPLRSSTWGFGTAIGVAVDAGARTLVMALGGSASTDGGAGMLAALGVRFHDRRGAVPRPDGGSLEGLTGIDTSGLRDLRGLRLVVATDVTNPLLGTDGAAHVFGPQKGADPGQVAALDRGLARLDGLLADDRPGSAGQALVPGAGSAGGLGRACAWLGADVVSGADLVLDLLGWEAVLDGCHGVVTGEGSLDRQSLDGKVVSAVVRRSSGLPVHAVVGRNLLTADESRQAGLSGVVALSDLAPDRDTAADPALSARLAILAGATVGRTLMARRDPSAPGR